MKQQLFEQQYRSQWDAFSQQLDELEIKGRKSSGTLKAFASHYRQVCHSLALAQERQYSPYLIDYLNDLALRGHQHLYRKNHHWLHEAVEFLLWGFPAAIRREYKFVWLGVLLFFGPLLLMGLLVWFEPSLIYSVHSQEGVREFTRMYEPAQHEANSRSAGENIKMFGFYIRNNISIGFQTFAGGFLLGLGAIFYLLYNGLVIGAVAGYLTQLEYSKTFWPFVIGHGAFELTAIAIAGAAGLKLGYGLLSPGRLSRKQSLINAAKEAMPLVYGTFVYLLLAAFLEAFWSSSQSISIPVKIGVGALLWVLSLSYLCLGLRHGSR